jgi:hypothetical protein
VPGLWQGTKGGVGPGSGNHWSDGVRDETGNYFLMNSTTFDNKYGEGAAATAQKLMSDPTAFHTWQQGLISINSVRRVGFMGPTEDLAGWPGKSVIENIYGTWVYTKESVWVQTENKLVEKTIQPVKAIDWKGVTNATILLVGGVAEMAIGGATEYFSAGISSSVSIPLIVDGGVRTATNAQRLWQYLNGNTLLANAYPTSIGSLAGKGIDMAFGKSAYSVGYGQAIGSSGNDLISFAATGGTGRALVNIQITQNADAYLNYLFTYLSYPYSLYHNQPNK